jgi:glycosyltransferase involved in cell wall biosynthesis
MKIVYISDSIIPSRAANSIHVMKMCQAFAHHGHDVVLLAPDKKDGLEPGVEDFFGFYGVKQNFRLRKISWRSLKGWAYIYGRMAARSALSYDPDLVICRNFLGCYFTALSGQDVVFESHAPIMDSGKIKQWFFNRLIKRKELKKLVVITHALKSHYEEYYPILKGRIHVAPDSADIVPSCTKPIEFPDRGKRMQVGYVGHLYRGRGVELIAEIARRCHWADFHFVGGTDADVNKWKAELKDIPNCWFHGFVPPSLAVRYRAAFDVQLAPYQHEVCVSGGAGDTSKWMSPLKVFEYMSACRAIISSDLPSLREVLKDEVNSLLCDPENVCEWEQALLRLSKDGDLAQRIAQSAHDDFVCNYTWQARAERLVKKGGA